MNRVILLATVTAFGIAGLSIPSFVKADPKHRVYEQQINHQQGRSYARDRDRDDRHGSRRESRRHDKYERRNHWRDDRHRDRRWARHYARKWHYRDGRHWRRAHRQNDSFAVGLGLGLLTYQIINQPRPRHSHNHVEYVRTPVRQTQPNVVYVQSQPQTNCLQEREYQTVVTIGGQEREAYGTACLQPDGSWLQGAPKFVPSNN